MSRCRLLLTLLVVTFWARPARAHDIPNARVDRSIQATVRPGRLAIDYEVSLSELTLTQDLRALIGEVVGGDRRSWYEQYGKLTAPLNAKGFLVVVDGDPVDLKSVGFDLSVEGHPRFTFHFEADLPDRGRLAIRDTNFETAEGTSRLALRGADGVAIRGDDLPADVSAIPVRPVWQLTDAEERRTRQVVVDFLREGGRAVVPPARPPVPSRTRAAAEGLSRLLDRSGMSVPGLWLIAMVLGAAHAIQPGHGKTLVAAASVGARGGWFRGAALALTITLAHMGGVLAVALALWMTRSTRYQEINRGLAHGAGFVIAAIGVWRLGRYLGGHGEHADDPGTAVGDGIGLRGLIGLGLAGGLVPCWDAVVLIVLAEAVGRLALGLVLLAAFSLGMAAVLVAVGLLACRLRGFVQDRDPGGAWVRRLGLLGALAVTAIGLSLLVS